MSYEYSLLFEETLGSIIAFNGIGATFSGGLNIAVYVLTALGLYAIAKRRGISKPWLAWLPVANVWILGSLSDQYRYVVKGEYKSKRKVLLTLSIIQTLIHAVVLLLAIVIVGNAFFGAMYHISENELMNRIMGPVFGLLGVCLPLIGVAIANAIVYYMALYDLYTSCDPKNNVMYLVLSILFGVTRPFFIFFNRDKDNGMPPRRQEASASFEEETPVWQSEPKENAEPWEKPDNQ